MEMGYEVNIYANNYLHIREVICAADISLVQLFSGCFNIRI